MCYETFFEFNSIAEQHSALSTLTALAAVFVLLVSFSSNVRAQCPPSTVPVPGPAWIGPYTKGPVTLPGTTCQVTITFCDRYDPIDQEWDMIMTSVTPVPGCIGCVTLSPVAIIQKAAQLLAQNTDAEDVLILPCDSGSTQLVHTYTMSCWKAHSEPVDSVWVTTYLICFDVDYCVTSCHICWDDNTQQYIWTGCTTTGTMNGPPCTETDDRTPWPEGICHTVPCGTPI